MLALAGRMVDSGLPRQARTKPLLFLPPRPCLMLKRDNISWHFHSQEPRRSLAQGLPSRSRFSCLEQRRRPRSYAVKWVKGVNQRLKSLSFTPEEGQALTLKVQFQERPTGKTTEYKELLGGRGGKIIVQIKQVECQAVLTGSDGVLWQAKNTFQTPDRNVLQGNDFQGMLDQQMWSQASAWASNLTIPSMLVKVGNKLEGLPHTFVLTGDQ